MAKISLPDYTKTEEIFNTVTHIVGAVLGLFVLVLCTMKAAQSGDVTALVSALLYGISITIMFTGSSLYHGLRPSKFKKFMRAFDHCDIYFGIAGSYTPILLVGIRPFDPILAWTLFAIEWGIAIVATIFTASNAKGFIKLSVLCYLVQAWGLVIFADVLIKAASFTGFMYFIAGGVAYTLGAILYGIGKRKRFMHSIFHIFVDIGAFLHFIGIYFYVF